MRFFFSVFRSGALAFFGCVDAENQMRNLRSLALLAFAVIAVVTSAPKLAAEQQPDPAEPLDTSDAPAKPSRFRGVVHLNGVAPIGEFADSADFTIGISAGGRYFLDQKQFLALYAGFGGANYASESEKFLGFEWTTATNMFFFEVGPQLHFGSGPVVPYIHGGVGFANFTTSTTLTLGDEELDSETGASDFNPSFSISAGCHFRVYGQWHLDLGVTYQHNGTMTRLIDDEEITSAANVVRFNVGVSF